MRAYLTNFTLLTLLAPTVAAIAAGDTIEDVWAGAGGFVVNIVDSGGHGRRLRRPQVNCSSFRARLRANLTNFTLLTLLAPTAAAIAAETPLRKPGRAPVVLL